MNNFKGLNDQMINKIKIKNIYKKKLIKQILNHDF